MENLITRNGKRRTWDIIGKYTDARQVWHADADNGLILTHNGNDTDTLREAN